ncbi:MAG: hypothetical protein BGO64_00790 [Aeromonas sp. 62-46]|jgi:hypothetical protein|nr:hypothetical protein AT59_21035 [Aeromonas hydrophila AD9]OJW67685.1 MAG: hypothetical protein BGO64_00790 [Aeromonas sp. 62-46]
MPAGICIISIVKCLQYINLGISDFFRISPRHRVVEIPAGFLIGRLDDAFVSCDTDDFLNKISFPYWPHERTA